MMPRLALAYLPKNFHLILSLLIIFYGSQVAANPHWDSHKVPKDSLDFKEIGSIADAIDHRLYVNDGLPILRVRVDWNNDRGVETYSLGATVIESSGTSNWIRKTAKKSTQGSYVGILKESDTGTIFATDSIGTGKEYRKLARSLTFRFPRPNSLTKNLVFTMWAEDPQDGVQRVVLEQEITPSSWSPVSVPSVKSYRLVSKSEAAQGKISQARVVIYAEGYKAHEEEKFLADAKRAMNALRSPSFPGGSQLEFFAVFAPSNKELGAARDLGLPVKPYDSFLGLYYPYWNGFGRWYHVVYPTSEEKFRQSLAGFAYDYPLVIVKSSSYWGVGNYMSHTAIPSDNSSFTYLLLHEIGHFFGLNEEYTGGGRTELEFAPEMHEPWSPNITFLANGPGQLKWSSYVASDTPVPTPQGRWSSNKFGAYRGGYGDSRSTAGASHIPGLACVMDRGANFCPICADAIKKEILR